MDTIKRTFSIESGPSADRLFDAVKYAYDEGAKVKVNFSIFKNELICPDDDSKLPKFLSFKLIGICHESGNNFAYILKGYTTLQEAKQRREVPFEAFYDSRLRKGSLTLLN